MAGMMAPLIEWAQTQQNLISHTLQQMAERGDFEGQGQEIGKGHRGLCKLVTFGGEAHEDLKWKAKLPACLREDVHRQCDEYVRRAQAQREEVTADAVELEFGEESAEVLEFSSRLKTELTGCCVKDAFCTVESDDGGNGLETLRKLMDRNEPRTALAKRAHLKAIITTNTPAKAVEELEAFETCVCLLLDEGRKSTRPWYVSGFDAYLVLSPMTCDRVEIPPQA